MNIKMKSKQDLMKFVLNNQTDFIKEVSYQLYDIKKSWGKLNFKIRVLVKDNSGETYELKADPRRYTLGAGDTFTVDLDCPFKIFTISVD